MPALGLSIAILNSQATLFFPLLFHSVIFLLFLPFLVWLFYIRQIKSETSKYETNKVEVRYPDVYILIKKICSKIGVKIPIVLYFENEMLNAIIIGSRRKSYLLISTSLCEKYKYFPKLTETILLHEMSHLKNGDLEFHGIAESLWKAFLLSGLTGILLNSLMIRDALPRIYLFVFTYLIPSLNLFYLNNMIKRWREIYADVRTIIIQGTRRNLMNTLRLFYPVTKSSSFWKILSPFTLTVEKRIKILQEDIFKHVLERGIICSVMNTAASMMSIVGLIFAWHTVEINFDLLAFIWLLITYFNISITLIPYWTYSLKNIINKYQHLFITFINPFKASLTLLLPFIILFFITPQLQLLVHLILLSYLFLLVHQLLFNIILTLTSLRASPKSIVFFSELLLLIFPITFLFHIMNLNDIEVFLISLALALSTAVILILLTLKYGKCPYCGKRTEIYRPFQCIYCSQYLNEAFLIHLND